MGSYSRHLQVFASSPFREPSLISRKKLVINIKYQVRFKSGISKHSTAIRGGLREEKAPGMYQFKVITHPTSDTRQPSLLLITDTKRYLFGSIPEGSQRALNQQKLKVSKLSTIFLTGDLNWERVGGLAGLILTISDQGSKYLNIVNGSGILDYAISSWRNFVFRFGMNITTKIQKTGESLKEEAINVKTINLKGSSNTGTFDEQSQQKLKRLVQNMFPTSAPVERSQGMDAEKVGQKKQQQDDVNSSRKYVHIKLPDVTKNKISTCYEIQFDPTRGKFQVEKAKQLNITNKRFYGLLASGKEVELEDGRIVKPADVLSESRIFQKVLVIDIPSNEFLQSAYETNWGDNVGLIFHFLADEVEPFSESYMKFIESFGPDCRHHISHPRYCPDSIVFEGSALMTLKLKCLLINQFNIQSSSEAQSLLPENISENIKLCLKGQSFEIVSTTKGIPNQINITESGESGAFDWNSLLENEVVPLNLDLKHKRDQILDESSVSSKSIKAGLPLIDQVETITLGTGSALPSKYRNVSSSLVRIPYESEEGVGYRSVLLDAGENTLGTIKRTLGPENLEFYFKELKLVYLSHLHADHHLGIISILKEWYKFNHNNDQPLYLVTPWQYSHFVNEWFNVEGDKSILDRITYISCENFLVGKERNEVEQIDFEDFEIGTEMDFVSATKSPKRDINAILSLYRDVGIKKLATCRAIHCAWAYSCSITFKTSQHGDIEGPNTFKVSYSGDTRPNLYSFSNGIGKASDLLIHEATLENSKEEEAKLKRHCTINEAIDVSNNMKAKKLILTHFSQRYPKFPEISNNIVVQSDYCYAFDGMIVKYDQISEQVKVIEEMKKIFENEINDDDDDALEDE